jgi:hypothetical protein
MKIAQKTEFLQLIKMICENCGDSLFSIDAEWSIAKKFLRKHITVGERSDDELNDLRKYARSLFNAIKKKTDEAYAMEAAKWEDIVALVEKNDAHFDKAFQAYRIDMSY